nr:unnamed protein product [Callosobruchus analis]
MAFPEKSKMVARHDNRNQIHWFTEEIRQYREYLHFLTRINSSNSNLVNNSELQKSRNIYRDLINKAKKEANDSYIKTANNKQKAIWDVIKSNSSIKSNSNQHQLSANDFNDHFVQIASNIISQMSPSSPSRYNSDCVNNVNSIFTFKETSIIELRDIITNLKNTQGKDAYNLSIKIIKTIKNLIVIPLCKILNECIASNIFPYCLKIARVVPVYKKGKIEDLDNYRPISIIPVFGKIFETILNKQIVYYFESNNLISDSQFGFRKGKSTTLALMQLVDYVQRCFDDGSIARATFYDLKKAFDCVSHSLLIQKLSMYGFDVKSIELIKSYLTDRRQYVSIQGQCSNVRKIEHGVPQGSIIGPTLFIVFINDLTACDSTHMTLLYADDTTIIDSGKDIDTLDVNSFVNDTQVKNWFTANKLSMNETKTQTIDFTLKRLNVIQTAVNSLGLYLDCRLTWEEHIRHLLSKLSKGLFVLRHLQNSVSQTILLQIYYSYFHSHMVYGVLLWGHSVHSSEVFAMQRKCVRVITRTPYRSACADKFSLLGILTLPSIYILECLLHVKKNIDNYESNIDHHSYNTRGRFNLCIPYNRINKSRDGHNYYGIKFFNVLPESIKLLTTTMFKRKLVKYLKQKAFYKIDNFLVNNFSDLE